MLRPMSKVESRLLSSGAGNAGGKLLIEENNVLHQGNCKRSLTGDDEELLAALKQQLEKKPTEKELQMGVTSIMTSEAIPADDGADKNNSSLVDSRGCAKPQKKLWFRGVRPSKFRHVYGLPTRKECCYTDISVVRSGNDGNFCAVNPTFLAIVADTTFVVIPINQTGRIDFQCCKVIGHTGQILDLKWNPFDDNMIASASDDCTIKVWKIPEGGLTSNLSECTVDLAGHKRKVMHIEWHPTASNVLISAGFDHLICLWDIGNSDKPLLNVISCHVDMIYSLTINRDGSLIATTSKDKKLRIIEPRSGIVVSEGVCHMGTKCSKAVFLDNNRILTTGFSRHSDRQYAVWNQHDLKKPLAQEVIDSSSGVVTPYFDHDTKMIYLAGKGDGNIRYYEVVDEAPYVYYLNQFLSGQPQKALGFMPKRGVNVTQCEVFRFYKLHATGNICEPISMIVPRKSTLFQSDLYPDTLANIPAIAAKEWFQGRNVQPILRSMKTGESIVEVVTQKNRTENRNSITIQHQKHNVLNNHLGNHNGTHNNTTNGTTVNGGNYTNGGSVGSQVNGKSNKENEIDNRKLDNNTKKFAFLSQPTIPDYRPQTIIEKSQKTSTNQSTKFHQLQAIFGQHQTANHKDITNLQNNLLSNSRNSSRNSSLENINLLNSENELRKAFSKQTEEIKSLRKSLNNSEKRVRELETEVKRLQLQLKH
ncbi:coronin-1C-like isoform X1 [Wyeomyia smithii]|uniref:coronin-1C-like isoform X1 n=1 Tax=Wyeomyia smithii TaxID=174621 RepID=UPI002467C360|nr:coronin-1C-like isoform X1 [Wyeomyia smithii]XP_055528247.1 coronin-1C-like isoform X1 [Wyeomyia smithii]XP_055528248.1 coronin-1C-like isoform X1 [Wyeomyia smithii]XP_055528249.1 coronin-1C-like isoform X1 [Wyeomyia smithii]